MDTKYLNTLKTIIEKESFQKAAESLNYAQSTITFHITQLEKELNIKLFEKDGNHKILTSDAKKIIPYLEAFNKSFKELKEAANDHQTGQLKIAIAESIITYKLKDILILFKQKFPNIDISIEVLNCYEIHQKVLNNQVDIGLQYDTKENDKKVIYKYLNDFSLTLIGSPSLNKNEKNFIKSEQIKSINKVQNDPNALFNEMFNNYLNNKKINLKNTINLSSIESIKQIVASGVGVAVLPSFTVKKELENQTLIPLKIDLKNFKLTAGYSIRSDKIINESLKTFIELVKEHFK